MPQPQIQIGDVIKTAGSYGVVLDIFQNVAGKRVFTIYFAKNAARLQPPETHVEDMLPTITPATVADVEDEIRAYQKLVDKKVKELRAYFPKEEKVPASTAAD